MFARLIEYKVKGAESTPALKLQFYPELLESKGVCWMNAAQELIVARFNAWWNQRLYSDSTRSANVGESNPIVLFGRRSYEYGALLQQVPWRVRLCRIASRFANAPMNEVSVLYVNWRSNLFQGLAIGHSTLYSSIHIVPAESSHTGEKAVAHQGLHSHVYICVPIFCATSSMSTCAQSIIDANGTLCRTLFYSGNFHGLNLPIFDIVALTVCLAFVVFLLFTICRTRARLSGHPVYNVQYTFMWIFQIMSIVRLLIDIILVEVNTNNARVRKWVQAKLP